MNAQDQSRLKGLIHSPTFESLQRMIIGLCAEWSKEMGNGSDEFSYLRQALERDGKIMGMQEFLKRLEQIANEDYDKARR